MRYVFTKCHSNRNCFLSGIERNERIGTRYLWMLRIQMSVHTFLPLPLSTFTTISSQAWKIAKSTVLETCAFETVDELNPCIHVKKMHIHVSYRRSNVRNSSLKFCAMV